MNHQLICGIIVVVEAWFVLLKDKVGLKTDYIVQESAELIHLTANHDVRSGVIFEIGLVQCNLFLERFSLLGQLFYLIAKLKDSKEAFFLRELLLLRNFRL